MRDIRGDLLQEAMAEALILLLDESRSIMSRQGAIVSSRHNLTRIELNDRLDRVKQHRDGN